MTAQMSLEFGEVFPFDASDEWQNSNGDNPPQPKDWAHSAARGVIADLQDRRGIDLDGIGEDVRKEIVESLAEIIREAKRRSA